MFKGKATEITTKMVLLENINEIGYGQQANGFLTIISQFM